MQPRSWWAMDRSTSAESPCPRFHPGGPACLRDWHVTHKNPDHLRGCGTRLHTVGTKRRQDRAVAPAATRTPGGKPLEPRACAARPSQDDRECNLRRPPSYGTPGTTSRIPGIGLHVLPSLFAPQMRCGHATPPSTRRAACVRRRPPQHTPFVHTAATVWALLRPPCRYAGRLPDHPSPSGSTPSNRRLFLYSYR